ncbi:hypothetical protein D1007_23493 [Hordeum vulgare]|uniref:Uncharacterized protein n=1 Tax=Hordeum vulgare subsp. vulgare TaxID=112509 RepID=A0A8I6WF77_HORVV|nr:hypothetical protein D1007_23493 [Hordeum vulgare]KAI5020489.1 hypothetical protein ZWY2020_045377 [Hordeum vulgare]
MAGLVSRPRRSVQVYWARRNYQRLGSPSRRSLRVARLGGAAGGRPRTTPAGAVQRRLRWLAGVARLRAAALLSPVRLLARLRDAYVDAMLALAGGAGRPCAALATKPREQGELWAKRVPRARSTAGGDFERRMMAHIYSALVTPELPGAAHGTA